MKYFISIFLLFTCPIQANDIHFDFGKKKQDFILEETQIKVPGYPDAFNPSLVRWHDGRLLMSFRARNPLTQEANLIGFVWLDESFKPQDKATLLTVIGGLRLKKTREQDPKLVKVDDRYYLVYNNIYKDDDVEARRMVVAELNYDGCNFSIIDPQYLFRFQGDKQNEWREKGWTPFDFKGTLLLSYSLNPHRVLRPLLYSDECETIAETAFRSNWDWGNPRGGTPFLRDGDHYFGFFHSYANIKTEQSKGEKISHYFMGAFMFDAQIPFAMTHISPEPLVGSTFYNAPEYPTWKPLKVIFPGGFIFDEKHVWVVYGRQDFESWVVKMDKIALIDSLVPVLWKDIVH